ncbi:33979_t:CDS:2, partial [Gigaspora margarita]
IINLEWVCQIIRSMKEILNYFRNHQTSLATLRRLQMEVYDKHISLLLPGDTRWGSVFYSASNFLETKVAIQGMTLEDNIKISDEIKNKILSDNFWFNLKILSTNRLTDPKVENCVYIQWNLQILRNLDRVDKLSKNMDFVENLVNDNDLEESVFDDLFSDN